MSDRRKCSACEGAGWNWVVSDGLTEDCEWCDGTGVLVTQMSPQTWQLPTEPGTEAKAVRGRHQPSHKELVFERVDGRISQNPHGDWWYVRNGDGSLGARYTWPELLSYGCTFTSAALETEE